MGFGTTLYNEAPRVKIVVARLSIGPGVERTEPVFDYMIAGAIRVGWGGDEREYRGVRKLRMGMKAHKIVDHRLARQTLVGEGVILGLRTDHEV